jgi:hypothetical protein
MSGRAIKKLHDSDADTLFHEPFLLLAARNSIATIQFLGKKVEEICIFDISPGTNNQTLYDGHSEA